MKFYDTSAVLANPEVLRNGPLATSSIVIRELESIKTSKNKSENVRAAARTAARAIRDNEEANIVLYRSRHMLLLDEFDLPSTNDNLIAAAALEMQRETGEDIEFVTDDIILSVVARDELGLKTSFAERKVFEDYKGFQRLVLDNDEMAALYERPGVNTYGLNVNEYAVICNAAGEITDVLKWDGRKMANIPKKTLKTLAFGDKIRPKDCYQQMAVDSILSNPISIITGKAGSGKSLLSLVASMYLIEAGKFDRLIVLFNPTSVRGASRLGYYSGDMIEKAMQTSIGNILSTKFGDKCEVDSLIKQDKIRLVSMADMRGLEVRDSEILYITEAQNTSADMLKLCLSRASQNSKVIIEGDYANQVDDRSFEGANNGMRRAIEVLKGEDIFGCVELQNVWRSKIAELVERM